MEVIASWSPRLGRDDSEVPIMMTFPTAILFVAVIVIALYDGGWQITVLRELKRAFAFEE